MQVLSICIVLFISVILTACWATRNYFKMVKTRNTMDKSPESNKRDKLKKTKNENLKKVLKKEYNAEKLQSNGKSTINTTSIEELLKLYKCVPVTVLLNRCDEIPKQKSKYLRIIWLKRFARKISIIVQRTNSINEFVLIYCFSKIKFSSQQMCNQSGK